MKSIISALTLAVFILSSGTASAHSLWITLVDSLAHPPGHVTSLLGFGHTPPFDDMLVGDFGSINLAKYELVGPDATRFDLGLPSGERHPQHKTPTNMEVCGGDLGLRKISCTGDSAEGTYQVAVESKPMFFSSYVDKAGKQRMAPKSMDGLKDAKKVLMSCKYETYAKSFFALKKWTDVKPLGHDLEIMPLDDLSDVHEGDLVRFKVMFRGQPLSCSESEFQRMTCTSNVFGGPDGFHLESYLFDGIATFRMPAAGQWVSNVMLHQMVADNPQLKDLQGKCLDVWIAASVSFNVKP